MAIRIAVNGFGRIGRLAVRTIAEMHKNLTIVAVNDLVPPENLAYLLKYDSVHGLAKFDISCTSNSLTINEKEIKVFSEKDPSKLPWKDLGVDYVIESTGLFASEEGGAKHLEAGARRVVITAPAQGNVPTFVMGVNHMNYRPQEHRVISNASCTTNCLAPLTKVLLENFGIEEGLMTTVHALTATQPAVDGPSKKDFRGGRAAGFNIIPASTGAAKAVGLVLPQVKGKLTGMAFRVPTADVSVVDLTIRLTKQTSYEAICETIQKSAEGEMKGIIQYLDEPIVSSDLIGNRHSCVFDPQAGIALNSQFFKLIAWYDNEIGYASRVVDLLKYMESKEK